MAACLTPNICCTYIVICSGYSARSRLKSLSNLKNTPHLSFVINFVCMACEVGVFMDKILFFIRLTALPWNYLLLLKRHGAVTARASYLLCTLIRGASLLDTGQPWIFQSNSEVNASSLETPECLYCGLWNCFNNDTISPSLCTVSSPLAKPGKLLPLVSLSQEKKSGTSIQMITELGKLSLCPLLPFVPLAPSRRSSSACLDLSGCSQGSRRSHGFTLNTFLSFVLAEIDCLVLAFFLLIFFYFSYLFWGIFFVFFLPVGFLQSFARPLIMFSLSLWLFS